jgi:hypothetical protein
MKTKILLCCLILLFGALQAFIPGNKHIPPAKKAKILVGAIRWDGWCGNLSSVGLQVEKDLGPAQFHYRAPFYSKVISADSIQCRCTTQAVMDQEIAYAKYAGIDYWAFCWYPSHSGGLDTARKLYLESKHKNDVKWCLIMGTNPFDFNKDALWLVQQFKAPNYQKVLGGRPLLYTFSSKLRPGEMERLRLLNKQAGNKDIYLVVMSEPAKEGAQYADSLKADAISAYVTWAYNNGGPYAPLIPKADLNRWNEHKATGKQVIPWITSGRNTLPRIIHETPWYTVPPDQWVQDGSPAEVGAHVQQAMDWIRANPAATAANTLIIYAWNEFDEGGWLCPTLGNNTSRLDAVRTVIKNQ